MECKISESEIINIIKQYSEEDIYNYAVMIDGEWGTGKTHFIKTNLKKRLENNELNSNFYDKNYSPRNVIYISLYGVKNIEEISTKIYISSYFEKQQKNGNLDKGISIASTLLSGGLSFLKEKVGIDLGKDNLKDVLEKFIPIKTSILIFDDLERCECPVEQILGYINGFVEHDGMKVIIVANQKEIKSENYNIIKEKLIGYTINYEADLKEVCTTLIKQIKNEELKKELEKNLDFFVGYMTKKEHKNIRTFQFYLEKISKLYPIIKNNIEDEHRDKEAFLEHCIQYTLKFSVLYKKLGWKNNWKESELVDWFSFYIPPNGESNENSEYRELEACIKFIDEFICYSKTVVESINNSFHNYIANFYDGKNSIVNRFRNDCFTMTNDEINNHIELIQKELKENAIRISDYGQIFYTLVQLESIGFKFYNNEIFEGLIAVMKNNVKNSVEEFDFYSIFRFIQYLREPTWKEKLIKIRNMFLEIEKERFKRQIKESLNAILSDNNWGEEMYKFINAEKNKEFLTQQKQFLSLVNMKELKSAIKTATPKDMSYLKDIINAHSSIIKEENIDLSSLIKFLKEQNHKISDYTTKFWSQESINSLESIV